MIENKNVETTAITTVEKEEKETIEMTIIVTGQKAKIEEGLKNGTLIILKNNSGYPFAPNEAVIALAANKDEKGAEAAYTAQLDDVAVTTFDCLNGKVVTGGFVTRRVLAKKLVDLGFKVEVDAPVVKIDRWGEGTPKGFYSYFKGSYAAQPIIGSLNESGIVARKSMEQMFQVNCELKNNNNTIATAYCYVEAGSVDDAVKVVEVAFSEHYGVDITVCTNTTSVKKPGIFKLDPNNQQSVKAVNSVWRNIKKLYTAAAKAEETKTVVVSTLETKITALEESFKVALAERDARIEKLEAEIALLKAKQSVKKDNDDEDPKPSTSVSDINDDDEFEDEFVDVAHCDDNIMNPNTVAKQEISAPEASIVEDNNDVHDEPTDEETSLPNNMEDDDFEDEFVDVAHCDDTIMNPIVESAVVEKPIFDSKGAESVIEDKKEEEPIVLSDEDIALIGSFFKPVNLAEPSQAVLEYDTAMADYVARRIEMYTELVKATHLLCCDIIDLQKAVKKDFRPNGLKIEAIAIKNDKVYVRANKCGRGGRAWYRVVKNEKIEILQDNFIKVSDF